MNIEGYLNITRETLRLRLEVEQPDIEDRYQGFVLVNVLKPETFEKEHIPGSINIPLGNEDEFERRFAKSKEIVLYCASKDCDASEKVAKELVRRGFTNVFDFEGGMKAWKDMRGDRSESEAA